MKTKKTKSKRKPVDATMRNVRAANKRIDKVETNIKQLWEFARWLDAYIDDIYQEVNKLNSKLKKAVR